MLLVGASVNCEPEMCENAITTHVTVVMSDPHSGHSEAVSIALLFRRNPAIETAVAFLTSRKADRTKTVCELSWTKRFVNGEPRPPAGGPWQSYCLARTDVSSFQTSHGRDTSLYV